MLHEALYILSLGFSMWKESVVVAGMNRHRRSRFPPQVMGGHSGDYGVAGLLCDSLESPPSARVGGLLSLGRSLCFLSIFNSATPLWLPGQRRRQDVPGCDLRFEREG